MKVTIMGAGNSGLAMSAHLSKDGHDVTLWNRSSLKISKLMRTNTIHSKGIINDDIKISKVTDNIKIALRDPDIILITTPAYSHKSLAELIAKNIKKSIVIVLNPGRTFGALEFDNVYKVHNKEYNQIIAETQTIIYTCRKIDEDSVDIIAMKKDVLISSLNTGINENVIDYIPESIQKYFIPAESMIQTSIGNVGMIFHCAPLLLNAGWTENEHYIYKYYYDGITPRISSFIEKIDLERVKVSIALGYKVESTKEWLERTYNAKGNNLYECIQNNDAYKLIEAPVSLSHRYILEDIPYGLVPLEAVGIKLGLDMSNTSLIIDLAVKLMNIDFRKEGRSIQYLDL